MSKRLCPFVYESRQAVKKQIGEGTKTREIRSNSSEKTLQLLFQGASKQFEPQEKPKVENVSFIECSQCSERLTVKIKCFYCDKFICIACVKVCTRCEEEHCKNCSFIEHDNNTSICYSCW